MGTVGWWIKVCKAIELSFEVVSEISPGIGVLDGGPHPSSEGDIFGRGFLVHLFEWRWFLMHWFEWHF